MSRRLLAARERLSQPAGPIRALGVGTGGRQFNERRLAIIAREHVPFRLPRIGLAAVALLALAAPPAWSQRTPDQPAGRQMALHAYGPAWEIDVQPPLPEAAQRVRDRLREETAAARAEVEQRIAREREQAISQLQTLADLSAARGNAADADAIRKEIARMNATTNAGVAQTDTDLAVTVTVPGIPDPLVVLQELRGHDGVILLFEVTYVQLVGSTQGNIWGTDVYTDDSSLAAAAVHAGALRDGEPGIVMITIAAPQEAYTGSDRNGVVTRSYGGWGGSFRIERAPKGITPPTLYSCEGIRLRC